MDTNLNVAILGAGHAGFAHAADLSLKGFEVRLCEAPEMAETIAEIKKRGGIESEPDPSTGLQGGFGKVHLITTDAAEAIDGADVIFVVVPAFAQHAFAKLIAPHVKTEQIVVLSPGNFGGAITFTEALKQHQCPSLPIICEAQSMMYACRKGGPDSIRIFGFKEGLKIAVFPAKLTDTVIPTLKKVFPKIEAAPNILWTWLSNPNAIGHPPVTILNAGWIEQTGGDFLFYVEGMTPAVIRVIDALDNERLALGKTMGLELTPQNQTAKLWYGHQGYEGSTYPDKARNPVYAAIKAEKELDSRYLTEDVPFGLVPLEDLGKLAGVEMPICTSLINLSNSLLDRDFRQTGQTLKSIGLEDMEVSELKKLVEEGYNQS
jgi:opine dehydrogenase